MTMGPAPRIMIDLMSVRFLMAPPVVQASKGAATAGMADDDEGGKFIVNFIFLGGDDERRLLGCWLLALSPLDADAMAATERPRPAVRALAAAARGWRAAIGGKVMGRKKREEKQRANSSRASRLWEREERAVSKKSERGNHFFSLSTTKGKKKDRSAIFDKLEKLSPQPPQTTMVLWIVGLGLADERDITLR